MPPTYYRGCWHVVSRGLFVRYRLLLFPDKRSLQPESLLPSRGVAGSDLRPLPNIPIAAGVDETFVLDPEEMYGEPFDIPEPDETLFMGWFNGGEVFRSGCTWTRGHGRIFYFQPGHETNASFQNENVQKIIKNAVKWACPVNKNIKLDCPHFKALENN